MTYQCDKCGHTFEKPAEIPFVEYPGGKGWTDPVSPCCHSCFEEIDQIHGPDCECGACTGEDRALEAMERGISACENMFEPDSDNPHAGEHHEF